MAKSENFMQFFGQKNFNRRQPISRMLADFVLNYTSTGLQNSKNPAHRHLAEVLHELYLGFFNLHVLLHLLFACKIQQLDKYV